MNPSFHAVFVRLFDAHFNRVYRYLNRLSGEPDLAADIAQEAFVKLYERGSPPETPEAWLITVATNLFRNDRSKRARRTRLMTDARAEDLLADPSPAPGASLDDAKSGLRVRAVMQRLPERDQRMLLLCAEGYSYREIAAALKLDEASVGTFLARAKRAFRTLYEGHSDAS